MKQNIQRFGLPVLSLALLCSCGGDAPPSSGQEAAAEEDFYSVDPAQAATISGKVGYKGEVLAAEVPGRSADDLATQLTALAPYYGKTWEPVLGN